MTITGSGSTGGADRRVRKSRTALLQAAVSLVAERGTTALSVSELADAAGVSRQVLYQQFSDRDQLLLAAALDLAEGDLLPRIREGADLAGADNRMLSVTQHFAQYRSFYRPMLTGTCAFGLNQALIGLLAPFNQPIVHLMSAEAPAPEVAADLSTFLAGGFGAVFNAWVIEGPDPLDPVEFADRILRVAAAITATAGLLPGSFLPN